jgi:hypothetical protein
MCITPPSQEVPSAWTKNMGVGTNTPPRCATVTVMRLPLSESPAMQGRLDRQGGRAGCGCGPRTISFPGVFIGVTLAFQTAGGTINVNQLKHADEDLWVSDRHEWHCVVHPIPTNVPCVLPTPLSSCPHTSDGTIFYAASREVYLCICDAGPA